MLTAGTFLLYEASTGTTYTIGEDATKWAILHEISEYPDLDSETDSEDNTTLSDAQHTYERALPDSGGSLDFSGYYNQEEYDKVKALEDEVLHIGVSFGGTTQSDDLTILPTGGKLVKEFNARVQIRLTSGGVGDVRPVTISVYPTTDAKTFPSA